MRRLLVGSVVVGIVAGLASVSLLALINSSLQGVEIPSPIRIGALFTVLCVLVTVARVGSTLLLALLGQGVVKNLRLELSGQVLSTPLDRLEDLGPHRLLATLTDDVNALTQALVFVPALCINGTIVLASLGYLAWLDLDLFALLLGAVAVGVVTYRLATRIGLHQFRKAREEQDALFQHFRSLTDGVKELKIHRPRRNAFVHDLRATTEVVRRLRVAASVIFGTAGAWGHLLFFVVIGVLLYARPAFVDADSDGLVAYTLVILYMLTPLQVVLDNFPNLSRAEVAVSKIEELGFHLAPADGGELAPTDQASAEMPAVFRSIELCGVSHTYRRDGRDLDFRLGPINFAVVPGELLFLVGGNGSGKTTLAKILVGLYRPESGEIRVDGRPVEQDGQDNYRQLFSVVFSDFFLFESLLGLEAPDLDEEARHYLAELRIDHKVRIQDGALSTTDLSQGQRKRLALLTAYLEDRPVYVFDEWAADQDPVFKEIFYHRILARLRESGKAVVVISHDDRYYHLADRIVKLEEGHLEYEGTYAGAPDDGPCLATGASATD